MFANSIPIFHKKESKLFANITTTTISLILTSTLRDLMKLILKENSFHFNGKHFLQTHGIAMATKMAVAFSVIFMAHKEKQLLLSSPHKPIIWKRFTDDIFSAWTSKQTRNRQFRWFCQQIPCHDQIHMWNVIRTRCFLRYQSFQRTTFVTNEIN